MVEKNVVEDKSLPVFAKIMAVVWIVISIWSWVYPSYLSYIGVDTSSMVTYVFVLLSTALVFVFSIMLFINRKAGMIGEALFSFISGFVLTQIGGIWSWFFLALGLFTATYFLVLIEKEIEEGKK